MLCCQGTTIQKSMMPSVLKLIKRWVASEDDQSKDYLGLTNLGLTEQMFGQILKKLKSIKPRSKHSKLVLEMNHGMSKLSQMTVEQYNEFRTEESRLGIIIEMSSPKTEKTFYRKGTIIDRDKRAAKRSAASRKNT